MEDIALELIELGAVFFGLGLLARLAGRIGLSPIPLYLLGGLAFGTGGIIPLTGIESFTSLAASDVTPQRAVQPRPAPLRARA